MQFHSFKSANELTSEMSDTISRILLSAIHERGRAYMVVSGGKTPIDLFNDLSHKTLPWEKVFVTLTDERCVDVKSPESNELLVRNHLLQNNADKAEFFGLFNANEQLTDNIQRIDDLLSQLPVFDVVILGMGEDGHTASLFPCSKEFYDGLVNQDKSVLIVNPQTAPFKRISLSKKRLFNSKHVFLHLLGQKKRRVLEESLLINNPIVRPIVAFLNDETVNIRIMYAPAEGEVNASNH